jgi:hypothetical protein
LIKAQRLPALQKLDAILRENISEQILADKILEMFGAQHYRLVHCDPLPLRAIFAKQFKNLQQSQPIAAAAAAEDSALASSQQLLSLFRSTDGAPPRQAPRLGRPASS